MLLRRHALLGAKPITLDCLCVFCLQAEDGIRGLTVTGVQTCALPISPTISSAELLTVMQQSGTIVRIVPHDRGEALSAADVALSSSGTATLECAIAGVPVVVMYRLSSPTHWLAQRLVKLEHFSLVNIVAGKSVVPELLQRDVNGVRIAREVTRLLEPVEGERVRRELAEVTRRLG